MGRSGEFGVGITPPSRRAACSPTQTCSSTIRRRPRRCGAGCSPSSIGSTPEWRTSKGGPGGGPRRCRPASPYSPEECVEQKFSEVAPASGFCYLECKRSGGGRGKRSGLYATTRLCVDGDGSGTIYNKRGGFGGHKDRYRWPRHPQRNQRG